MSYGWLMPIVLGLYALCRSLHARYIYTYARIIQLHVLCLQHNRITITDNRQNKTRIERISGTFNWQKFIALTITPCQFKINKRTSNCFPAASHRICWGPRWVNFCFVSVTKSNYRFMIGTCTICVPVRAYAMFNFERACARAKATERRWKRDKRTRQQQLQPEQRKIFKGIWFMAYGIFEGEKTQNPIKIICLLTCFARRAFAK